MRIYKEGTQIILKDDDSINQKSIGSEDAAMITLESYLWITERLTGVKVEKAAYTIVKDKYGNLIGDKATVIKYLSKILGVEQVVVSSANQNTSDSFGRQRTSSTGQRFDAEFIYDLQPSLFDQVVAGSGTVVHNSDSRDGTLAVGDAVDASAASLTQHWHNPYTAGNSQLIDITGTLDGAAIGGGVASVFVKSGIDSSEVEYLQSAWSEDAATDVDWSASQIFQMDFQSLKVGTIRFNLVRNGEPITVHKVNNDNLRSGGYWQYPSLPLRWRIYNTATKTIAEIGYFDDDNGIGFRYTMDVNASASLRAICSTVKSEGGEKLFDLPGFNKSADMGVTAKTVSTTLLPLISISPSDTFNSLDNRGLAIPLGFEIMTNNPVRYAVILNGTLTGASFTTVSGSAVSRDVAATVISGGDQIASGYTASGGRNVDGKDEGVLGKTLLSKGYNPTADVLTICAVKTDVSDASVFASINWKEIR